MRGPGWLPPAHPLHSPLPGILADGLKHAEGRLLVLLICTSFLLVGARGRSRLFSASDTSRFTVMRAAPAASASSGGAATAPTTASMASKVTRPTNTPRQRNTRRSGSDSKS